KAEGAMCALLRQAFNPNLVQTIEHVPAFVHGGPFANIAHGCSSLMATKLALKLADIVVTEAGFGAELGAEKFFDIKCRIGGLKPSACVLVATLRALRHHGGADDVKRPDLAAVKRGFCNLEKQIGNVLSFGVPLVVAINSFENDSQKEVEWVKSMCEQRGVSCETTAVYEHGGVGGQELAKAVLEAVSSENNFRPLYDLDEGVEDKITKIAKTLYGAGEVVFTENAKADIRVIEEKKQSHLPVCVSKTQKSLSDDPLLLGAPKGFRLTVTGLKLQAGAGFIVVYTGKIITMPGLPEKPGAESIDVDGEGVIHGLF
ncbi:MAG: formate--tetrahydrofolate ligase, partial [Candidatus Altiarchaeales archaeon]|nr:formate--tetrahydrofolate ligase [Candidatus Altiarchaeales archaeon]